MSTVSSFISDPLPDPLPIGSLIMNRVLDLAPAHLLRRAGYKNIAKGLRRLDELLAGELVKTKERDAPGLWPPHWGDCELHAGSRYPVRSRWQSTRNTSPHTLPSGSFA
jgi:hypothetical protein